MLYKKNVSKTLDENLFKNPTSEYRATPFWAWNDDGNELDNSGEIRYSKKGYSHRNPNTVTQNEYEHHYWAIANNFCLKMK